MHCSRPEGVIASRFSSADCRQQQLNALCANKFSLAGEERTLSTDLANRAERLSHNIAH